MTVVGCFFMSVHINMEDLIQKILILESQNVGAKASTVVLASRGIFETEVVFIEKCLNEKLALMGREINLQWVYGDSTIRCGLCHSIFNLKKLNTDTVLCPVCEFKSVELLSDKEVNIFSVLG